MKPYHPVLVTLHWLLAIAMLFLLFLGDDIALGIHLPLGVLVGGLFTIRSGVKLYAGQPSSGDHRPVLARLSNATHNIIYAIVFAVVFSGFGAAVTADLFEVIRNNGPLPQNYSELEIISIHGALTKALLIVVCSHIFAAFFHQFILADSVLSRMWFGR